jgi:hypothetical protein
MNECRQVLVLSKTMVSFGLSDFTLIHYAGQQEAASIFSTDSENVQKYGTCFYLLGDSLFHLFRGLVIFYTSVEALVLIPLFAWPVGRNIQICDGWRLVRASPTMGNIASTRQISVELEVSERRKPSL